VKELKSDGKIYTACRDGKIPFIGARDVAAAAASLLIRTEMPGVVEYRPIGPKHLCYDEVCTHLSRQRVC
jgi:festuclavine dehydrogenase